MAEHGRRKKMAAHRASTSAPQPDFDLQRFKSYGCEKFYETINFGGKFIKEKAFQLAPGEFEEIRANIADRGWERLVSYPRRASRALVFEFFTNVFPRPADGGEKRFRKKTTYVRGENIRFDYGTLNDLFGTVLEEGVICRFRGRCDRRTIQEDPDRTEEIRATLCREDQGWVRNAAGAPQKILVKSLTPVARGWAAFVLSTLSPCSNQTELNTYRAALVCCIMRGEPIDIGRILEKEIKEFAEFKEGALPSYWRHASLVSLLCEQRGVVAEADEDTIDPAVPITAHWIGSRLRQENTTAAAAQQPPQEMPEFMDTDGQGPSFNFDDFGMGPSAEDFQSLRGEVAELRQDMSDFRREHRFGMRALWRALAAQSGGQMDPEADIFQEPPQ